VRPQGIRAYTEAEAGLTPGTTCAPRHGKAPPPNSGLATEVSASYAPNNNVQ
jgi:hypothetical protein